MIISFLIFRVKSQISAPILDSQKQKTKSEFYFKFV